MMTGTYASNSALRDKAETERAARVEAKRTDVVARLEALKDGQR